MVGETELLRLLWRLTDLRGVLSAVAGVDACLCFILVAPLNALGWYEDGGALLVDIRGAMTVGLLVVLYELVLSLSDLDELRPRLNLFRSLSNMAVLFKISFVGLAVQLLRCLSEVAFYLLK